METAKLIIQLIVGIPTFVVMLIGTVLFFQFRWPNAAFWGLKVVVSALSPAFLLIGLLAFVTGITTNSMVVTIIGICTTIIYFIHIIAVTRPPKPVPERTFDPKELDRAFSGGGKYFLKHRTVLKLPSVPEPEFEQDISFATVPDTGRKLLCDVWQPHKSIKPSGLVFIYLHGSAFYILDKDYGTRPFFRHLAAQGHVIMDVAYRLAPETDLMGMIHDVRRAIAWMKKNAEKLNVDPNRIVLCGGSAGGYLALMAGYTATKPGFNPTDLVEDTGCAAVIGLYPATDLEALYFHTNQHLTTRSQPGRPKKKVPTEMPAWLKKRIGKDYHRLGFDKGFGNVGTMAPLMGCHPDECPEKYEFFSPINHVSSNCPPTLLIQGKHDIMTPVLSTQILYDRLIKENIPAFLHLLPQTDHAFDLFLPGIAPAAHNAIYDIERFLLSIGMQSKIPDRAPSLASYVPA